MKQHVARCAIESNRWRMGRNNNRVKPVDSIIQFYLGYYSDKSQFSRSVYPRFHGSYREGKRFAEERRIGEFLIKIAIIIRRTEFTDARFQNMVIIYELF